MGEEKEAAEALGMTGHVRPTWAGNRATLSGGHDNLQVFSDFMVADLTAIVYYCLPYTSHFFK